MTTIIMYRDKNKHYVGFELSGHANDDAYKGHDIVCAAISMLTINTINSIENLLNETYSYDEDAKSGYMKCYFDNPSSDGVQLLLNSMVLGLSMLEKQYKKKKYLKLIYEEV